MNFIKSFILIFIIMITSTNNNFAQTTEQKNESLKTINVKVKGITCSLDLKTITDNIEKLAGINSCKTKKKGAISSFEITFNPVLVTEKEIHAAIENTGGCKNPNDRPYKVKQ